MDIGLAQISSSGVFSPTMRELEEECRTSRAEYYIYQGISSSVIRQQTERLIVVSLSFFLLSQTDQTADDSYTYMTDVR